jgi:hypothetical protein
MRKILAINFADDIRLTRGFLVYATFPIADALLGINDGLQAYVLENINAWWVAAGIASESEHLLGYVTTVAGMFVWYGAFAGAMLFALFLALLRHEDPEWRILLYVIVLLSFSQTILFNAWWLFYYSVYLGLCDKRQYGRNYVSFRLDRSFR